MTEERDVLREAGIETFNRHAMSGHPDVLSMVLVRLADVEGLVRERDDYKAALREVQDNIRASAPQTAGREVTEVLDAAENKLRQMACEFMGPNFTDRYDDGPAMLKIAERIAALRAAGTAGSVPASGASPCYCLHEHGPVAARRPSSHTGDTTNG